MTTFRLALAAILVSAGVADAQTLEVSGDVISTTVVLSEGDLTALPQHLVEVRDGDRTVRFEGPWLADVLERAGVTFGHGPGLTQYVIVEAADGYSVVYAWPNSIHSSSIHMCCWPSSRMARCYRVTMARFV